MDESGNGQTQADDVLPEGVEIVEAAAALGLTLDGVRKRIKRGLLRGYKQGGRWYVHLDKPDSRAETRQAESSRHVEPEIPPGYRELLDHLKTENAFLRDQVRALTNTNNAMAARILQLEAPRETAAAVAQEELAPTTHRWWWPWRRK